MTIGAKKITFIYFGLNLSKVTYAGTHFADIRYFDFIRPVMVFHDVSAKVNTTIHTWCRFFDKCYLRPILVRPSFGLGTMTSLTPITLDHAIIMPSSGSPTERIVFFFELAFCTKLHLFLPDIGMAEKQQCQAAAPRPNLMSLLNDHAQDRRTNDQIGATHTWTTYSSRPILRSQIRLRCPPNRRR